ncbi:MAG: 16S rRNA (cytosine(1402)-N(4))-methyltransferase RsmH [Bacteroidetes bacterium]|nr:16S rRNA (cytosine(1402)-N(4))-methyltransferase RsmH [Bacteroidota bacterium]
MSNDWAYHKPVLLHACIKLLNIKPNGVYVDLTFGGGGHSKEILKHLGKDGKLFAFDQDSDAVANTINDDRFTLIPHNFRFLKSYLRLQGVLKVDGILADLGVSSHQFDEAERGFSIRFNSDLDMRMNKNAPLSAKNIINEYDEASLTKLFKNFGEIENAKKLTSLILSARVEKTINTTQQLIDAIEKVTPKFEAKKFHAQVFQALRIEVNQELEALKEALQQSYELLNNTSNLVVISYHSLEDRLVKNFMKAGNIEGNIERDIVFGTTKKYFELLTTKPIVPDDNEINENSRARSAKLRAAKKI